MVEQEACETIRGLFKTFGDKFKPYDNEMILSLQYSEFVCQSDESAEE